jgi:Rieske Fe-S protein
MSDTRVKVSGESTGDGRLGRRTVLRGAALGGVGVTALAACGSDDSEDSSNGGDTSNGGADPTDGGNGGGGDGGGGEALGPTSEVPVGGGVVYTDQEVVVTQPTAGEFVGFSAICKHQGCVVAEVSDGTINCGCHGSQYAIEDGSVVTGPATSSLDPAEVTVEGQEIVLS